MKLSNASRLAAHLATALSATAALAAGHPAAVDLKLPAEQHAGIITYRSGGVGHDEAVAMIKAASGYPLELVFVTKHGTREEYLADIPVTIKDAHGKVVFEGRSDGPYFLARLPEGQYLVTARREGETVSRHATVGTGKERVVFSWHSEGSPQHA